MNNVTYNHYNLLRNPAGRSLLPTSVAGFMQAKRRKLGCFSTSSSLPFSNNCKEAEASSNNPDKHSNVSADAKFISSNRTQ